MSWRQVFEAALVGLTIFCTYAAARMDECYLSNNPQRCLPPFVNAAYGRTVVASNTCGTPAEEFCLQTGVTGVTKSCHTCDNADPALRHDASLLTDFNNEEISTWWQSSTMLQAVQYPTMVNLTLNLTKSFDITYVRLKFHTSRPESFSIYKKTCDTCDWQPFQYYSGSCFATYGLDNKGIVTAENEQKALCTDDFSDISPLTGGNVAFSTLEGRPSAYNFDRSGVLQDWVKAVAIRITLDRINTFGDEVFRDPKVLKSYYYAISDLSIGGRCSCNGHASECYLNFEDVLTCRCRHNTAGRDCEKCAPMFNDRPWSRATRDNAAECAECDCNGMSDSCYFDAELYRQTGRGGHCTNCRDNTAGPHCEFCLSYHFRDPATNRCTACECSGIGATSQQCDESGQCTCKPGVGGARCDQCMNGYFGLSEAGCSLCQCSNEGTTDGTVCDADTGACVCKLNVEGNNCDRCKPGFMNLQATNPYGCTACFCYGHSSVCSVSPDYTVAYIISDFQADDDNWQGRDYYGNPSEVRYNRDHISMFPDNYYMSYFVAPEKYTGLQVFSYNQMLEFDLWVEQHTSALLDTGSGASDLNGGVAVASGEDLILVGEDENGDDMKVSISITGQGNRMPTSERQLYRFRLHEAAGFRPRITPFHFQLMLNTLKKIEIRSTYGEGLVGHLDNVQMTSAEKFGAGPPADWVERCEAVGFTGPFADECAPGFTRDPPNGDELAACIPCNCNGHGTSCDPVTGVCECDHNTMGDHCELCAEGYYFNGEESRRGTPHECQSCPCPPNHSACALMDDGSVVCTSCPPGHAGKQCEMCTDGWFGDPRTTGPCQRCMCNGNIDDNAIMNCNSTSGECLKCIHNTTGFHCDECLPGYFGKAVTNIPEERCQLCECNHLGSRHIATCNPTNGRCDCLPNVEGRTCDRCRAGYWNLHSGEGCESCNCHMIGSSTGECDQESGQCECKPGVGGQTCSHCLPNHFNMSRDGCTACECNVDGSASLQCNEDGRCDCKEGVLGIKCDQCQENYYDLASGCVECPACYGLVQDAVDTHRAELARLKNITENIGDHQPMRDSGSDDFLNQLAKLNATVQKINERAERNKAEMQKLREQTDQVEFQLQQIYAKLTMVEENVASCNTAVEDARETMDRAQNDTVDIKNMLGVAQEKLDQAMMDLMDAQDIAQESLSKENNMSRLAEEAETLANTHQLESQEVVETSQQALDTSRQARDAVQSAIDTLEQLISTLTDLIDSGDKIPAARALRDELIAQSPIVKNNAEAAKNESTDLFTKASKLTVPDVDTEDMDTRSQNIINEAQALIPEIDRLDEEYKTSHINLEAQISLAELQLKYALTSQNNADKLMAQVHSSEQAALEAVTTGNDTYQLVLNSQATLESFDNEITSNRERAEEALSQTDDVQRKIDLANNKTANAQAALGTAREIAVQASNKAQQALNIAGNIQSSAQTILNDAVASAGQASAVSEKVDRLTMELDQTEMDLSSAEQQAATDQAAVVEATGSATDAANNAERTRRKVDAVLGELQDILNRLNNMADVNENEISDLEAELERLRAQVEEANLPGKVEELEAEVNKQNTTLADYDMYIAQLQADIENLSQINQTIPVNCYSATRVEQD
uniref:Laminin subunit gamma-1-like n=1 Tax=Phallusia mammillata TaxID=59560 RepID=A0A6F9DIS7_9ASCI|nr:laminin subunit gamma-1-like [Phallusia mammillata]